MPAFSVEELREMAIEDAVEAQQEGRQAAESGKYSIAIDKYTSAIELLDDSGADEDSLRLKCLLGRGAAKLEQGNHADAKSDFTSSVALDALCGEAYIGLGKALQAVGDTASARQEFVKAQDLGCSNEADACLKRLDRSQSTAQEGNSSQASKIESHLPDEAVRAKEAGNAAFKVGQFGDAIKLYTKALESLCNPGQGSPAFKVNILTNRAISALKDGQLRQCREDCSAALEIDPTNLKALARRAGANEQSEKYEAAVLDFAKVLNLNPSDSLARKGFDRVVKVAKQLNPSYKPPALTLRMTAPISLIVQPSENAQESKTLTENKSQKINPIESKREATASRTESESALETSHAAQASSESLSGTQEAQETPVKGVPLNTRVLLKNLSRSDLNGQIGKVISALNSKGRQEVKLEKDDKVLALRPTNVFEIDDSQSPPSAAEKVSNNSPSSASENDDDLDKESLEIKQTVATKVNIESKKPDEVTASSSTPCQRADASSKGTDGISNPNGEEPRIRLKPKCKIEDATKKQLAAFPVDELIGYIVTLRAKSKEDNEGLKNITAYMERLLDRVMERDPEILNGVTNQ